MTKFIKWEKRWENLPFFCICRIKRKKTLDKDAMNLYNNHR